jgi:hypothetical protein
MKDTLHKMNTMQKNGYTSKQNEYNANKMNTMQILWLYNESNDFSQIQLLLYIIIKM